MKPKANYKSRKFGLLTVMECVVESNGHNKGGIWLCKCKCRKIIQFNGYQLHSRSSCGCLVRKAAAERGIGNRKTTEEKTLTKTYHQYKINNKELDILTKTDWLLMAEQKCQLCGDISKLNNVVWADTELIITCDICKCMKGKLTHGQFVDQVVRISEYMQSLQ